jgi:DNA repair exonuclease SbcCD nuclease subunit
MEPTARRRLTLLHTADIHLDNRPKDATEPPKAHRAFGAIIDHALDARVDLVLIVGDLFDHNRVADETVAFAQCQLRRLHCPVVILPGNHDCLHPNGIYRRHDFGAACGNVRVIIELDGQTIAFPDLGLVVWGRGMEAHEPGFRPLAHIPARRAKPARWHVAMAHGFFYEDFEPPERSSPILAAEIRRTGWDYVALGHKHVMADHSQGGVAAWYPGTPLPDWSAAPPGYVLLVECCPERGVTVRPQQVAEACKAPA